MQVFGVQAGASGQYSQQQAPLLTGDSTVNQSMPAYTQYASMRPTYIPGTPGQRHEQMLAHGHGVHVMVSPHPASWHAAGQASCSCHATMPGQYGPPQTYTPTQPSTMLLASAPAVVSTTGPLLLKANTMAAVPVGHGMQLVGSHALMSPGQSMGSDPRSHGLVWM